MTKFWQILKWLVISGAVIGVFLMIFALVYFIRATKDLPSVEALSDYKPPVMSRVHAGDGKLISEFRKEARVFVPIETIPKQLQHAFVAAEDKRFYSHNGWDPIGLSRAALMAVPTKLQGRRVGGTSTITQQVAKNFLVGDEYSIDRKLREIMIARRMEKALTKDEILELYVNEIYFGRGAYGVAAASLNYFGKPMHELDIAENAYMAVLPKGPNNYQLSNERGFERAKTRQSYVLGRMAEDGYITESEAEAARLQDLVVVDRFDGDEYLAAEYFVEEARKQIFNMYGEDELYEGGLSIRTTLDTRLQLAGRNALRSGLEAFDMRRGYRGPIASIDGFSDWKAKLDAVDVPSDIGNWRVALVMNVSKDKAELAFDDDLSRAPDDGESTEDFDIKAKGELYVKDMAWAGKPLENGRRGPAPEDMTKMFSPGDVILVERQNVDAERYNLRQVPNVNGGLVAMDPHTGRVLALVGGYSFEQSQFNRVTQAYRQPGSAFKPFVYAAALEEGYTPATQVLDAPFIIERDDADECREIQEEEGADAPVDDTPSLRRTRTKLVKTDDEGNPIEDEECEVFYKPANYNQGQFYGLKTLRFGLEKSKNAMTVRMANDIGMGQVKRYGEDMGIYDEVKSELAWALGAGETTMLRLATGYSELVNGGKKITPTILDRVQDGDGKTIFVHANKTCTECQVEEWTDGSPPALPDDREQVMDPVTAYQITYMLKGVVDNGTGRSISVLGRPLGGKTGTTNDYKDAWFMGFSPDLVAGVYVGYDTPRPLANEAGGKAAAPIFRDFMREALKDKAVVPFRIPEGITLSPVTRDTGEPSYIGAPDFILEAFRAGTEPKLGDLSSTIRVGTARDSFFGGGFDFEDDVAEAGDSTVDGADVINEDDNKETLGEDSNVGENALPDTPSPAATPVLADPETSVPTVNNPLPADVKPDTVEPKEDELEDGLY
ncbi:penicillin-binding protein 1A [Fretibacter rubidus]|uniref:penicillin-binding protein 1A n=1 Tax=Fretibacter rubidus TaxID=570162 RepID=UPI00352A0B28